MYDTVAVESVRLARGRGRGVARYRTLAVYGPPTPAERRRNDTLECRSPHQRTYSHLN